MAGRGRFTRVGRYIQQFAALELMVKNQHITNREYRDLFPDVGEETICCDLTDLVEEGLLLKMSDKKGTHYILK